MEFYNGTIEDPAGLPENMQQIDTIRLISGAEITHPVWLCGGGQNHKRYFLKAIGDKKYKNAFEWCAGHGEIGFEIITAGICETLAFSDLHPGSEEWCLKNAELLNLSGKVRAYTTPVISAIPTSEKWDLVVGNPPNAMGVDLGALAGFRRAGLSDDHIQAFARTTWDIGLETHREFFQNIGKYLTDDADIFISVHITLFNTVSNIAGPAGFEAVKIIDMFPDPLPEYVRGNYDGQVTDPGLKVVHFKKKILTS
jgi:methylase of polypeptide subunit release factors